ncbi:phosphatases II [Sodiomyces alkalinus F11]|uniref:Phosphatases II n=1 Tax=Sodiomyces alkalinus (strain CBS 110278 / VKM F-3762 / F11) TaxID=1314773 RepID=A0A3N2Q1A4_SODAK|nr:phosphatases II [Sodiomyces alkalinus F11]ROT40543.1 phosphatases II [Sodiomyces alkalinus F11]
MQQLISPGISSATATAPYTQRPPSPPHIHIPLYTYRDMIFLPSNANLAALGLTQDDMSVITDGYTPQMADNDPTVSWSYESRRSAQRILDWLYLGPSSAARDLDFLKKEEITMVLAIRYAVDGCARAMSFLNVGFTPATRDLGIAVECVEVKSAHHLAAAFPAIIRKINDHILAFHRQPDMGPIAPPGGVSARPSRGRVLVVCETGNERSGTVVAAYLMAMFNVGVVEAICFLNIHRLSASLTAEPKHLLTAWEDILKAERVVSASQLDIQQRGSSGTASASVSRKRSIGATFDDDEDVAMQENQLATQDDRQRFGCRTFTPFADTSDDNMAMM